MIVILRGSFSLPFARRALNTRERVKKSIEIRIEMMKKQGK
jgi:hypothetical protein